MGMKAKVPVGVSAQGKVKLADDELIKLFDNCIRGKAETACVKCPYRKTMYICSSNQLHVDVLALLRRQQKRIKELGEKTAESARTSSFVNAKGVKS